MKILFADHFAETLKEIFHNRPSAKRRRQGFQTSPDLSDLLGFAVGLRAS